LNCVGLHLRSTIGKSCRWRMAKLISSIDPRCVDCRIGSG
jgi:hypothetical protein